MAKFDERREKLCRFRDYGIWAVAVLLIANFWLWNIHDKQVRNELKPQIKHNTELVDSNHRLILEYDRKFDSLVKVADSVFTAVHHHHKYEVKHDAAK